MPTVYYHSFDVALIAADGYRQPMLDTDVEAYNVTQSSSLGTLTTTDEGIIVEGSFSANVGDVVEFSVTGYPLTFRQTLQETQAKAYTAVENFVNTFIVQNLYDVTNESESAELFVEDRDAQSKPVSLGTVRPGTNYIPYPVTATRNLRLSMASKDIYQQRSDSAFETMETFDLTVPGPAGAHIATLFDRYSDTTTAGTTRETLYTDPIAAGTLNGDGDKLKAVYSGTLAANGNNKRLIISIAGTDILDTGTVTSNDLPWRAEVDLIRVSNTAVRITANLNIFGVSPFIGYEQVTSLNLTTTAYDIEIDAVTSASAGDVTASMGNAFYIPRKPQTAFGTQLSGVIGTSAIGTLGAVPFIAQLGGIVGTSSIGNADHYVAPGPIDPNDPDPYGDYQLEPPVS